MRYPLLLTLLLAVPLSLSGNGTPETFDTCQAAAANAVRSARTDFGLTGISFAMAVKGTLNCAGAVGHADTATGRAMLPTTLMRIGSLSKVMPQARTASWIAPEIAAGAPR